MRLSFSTTSPSDRPIFVFASTQRCGSTLLQRLLNSCAEIMIWGEHTGHLNSLIPAHRRLLEWEARFASHRKAFLLQGHDNFLPNIVPEDYELRDAAAAYVVALFGVPAARLGRPIWGFKEVRYGAQVALFLQDCFPGARFIHLTRNVVNCFISLKHWEDSPDAWNRKWTENSLQDWARINASFLKEAGQIRRLLAVRFEDMVADHGTFIHQLAEFLELSPGRFDPGVFDRRLHDFGSAGGATRRRISPSDLDAQERRLLLQPELVDVARQYGYQIEF